MFSSYFTSYFKNHVPAAIFISGLLLLAGTGCGQKGPLYLPNTSAGEQQEARECPDKRCTAEPPQITPEK
ncbi:MAG: lipoprotein [Ketobacteraceae bacterium]|nr:lipoprotein [Ketobacteraceae bacterium]